MSLFDEEAVPAGVESSNVDASAITFPDDNVTEQEFKEQLAPPVNPAGDYLLQVSKWVRTAPNGKKIGGDEVRLKVVAALAGQAKPEKGWAPLSLRIKKYDLAAYDEEARAGKKQSEDIDRGVRNRLFVATASVVQNGNANVDIPKSFKATEGKKFIAEVTLRKDDNGVERNDIKNFRPAIGQ